MTASFSPRAIVLLVGAWMIVGSSALAAQQERGDSVLVTPSTRYDQSRLFRSLRGQGRRDLWSLPILVEEADLGSLGGGGLTPVRRGGGTMSQTLHMRGADGRFYVMRSVDKFPDRGLGPEVEGTIVADVARSIVAYLHPSGALVAPRLLEAAGILHTNPIYYRMPDDERLGEFREDFAGLLVLFEERPRDAEDGAPPFAGASKISNTANFKRAVEESSRNRVDVREILKARLVDMFLGDRDRSVNNWLWARFDQGDGYLWRPIPRDRDQVFVQFDGLVGSVARMWDPRFVTFSDEYASIVGLTRNAWDIDRPLLTALSDEEWSEVVADLKAALSDQVIEDAVLGLPHSHYEAVGEDIVRVLKVRRNRLDEAAAGLYDIVFSAADVHFTDEKESIVIERLLDGSVSVMASERTSDGTADVVRYSRVFRPGATKEVRIYAHGGNDVVRVQGGGDHSIRVRILGGGGTDDLQIVAGANTQGIDFYDDRDTERLAPNSGIRTHAFRPASPDYWPATGLGPGTPDFGGTAKPTPLLGYSSDNGVVVGWGRSWTRYGFAQDPFRSRIGAQVGWATLSAKPVLRVSYEHRNTEKSLQFELRGLTTPLTLLRYHGMGNETSDTQANSFYDPDHILSEVAGRVKYSRSSKFTIGVGLNVSHMSSDTTAANPTLLSQDRPYGSGTFSQVGIVTSIDIDLRDSPLTPRSGVAMTLGGGYYPGLLDVELGGYSDVHGTASAYISAEGSGPTLALRAGGRKVFGVYPFSNGALLGGAATVRGIRDHRFLGDAVAHGSAEVRIELFRSNAFLPLKVGGLAFFDFGRVFLDGEVSNVWRTGHGGGLSITPDVAGYRSLDDMRLVASIGFSGGSRVLYLTTQFAF